MNYNDIIDLLGLAHQKLKDAEKLLQALNKTSLSIPNKNVETGLEAIQTYLDHAEEIINWLKQ